MDRRTAWVLGIVFGGLFLCLFAFMFVLYLAVRGEHDGLASVGGDRVGVVEIVGQILDSKRTLRDLREFEDDDRIKSIVVRIDSPGGAVGPSQEIYEAIRKLHEKKRVVASMGSVAASGGFYIACAADKVFANPGTLTGSIGVIFQVPNVEGVLRWAGVRVETVASGKMKDSGSPFREMTAEERAYFQEVLADVHAQFVDAVVSSRNLDRAEVQSFADGRVFTGRQAKEWKLVDELGGFNEAVAEAGRLGGIRGQPEIEYPRRERKFLRELLGDDLETLVGLVPGTVARAVGAGGLEYRLPIPGY